MAEPQRYGHSIDATLWQFDRSAVALDDEILMMGGAACASALMVHSVAEALREQASLREKSS